MKYFTECETLDDVKQMYKRFAEVHPVEDGKSIGMQAINAEYALACAKIIQNGKLSPEDVETELKNTEEYRSVIEKVCKLDNVKVEMVGNWIWVSGNTLAVKKELKEAGLQFSPKKFAWYYRSDVFQPKSRDEELNKLRDKYGSEEINSNEPKINRRPRLK